MKEILKIIIADDHKIFRKGLEVILNGIPNFKVIASVSNGKQLLNILRSHKPDIILLDIQMPEINGIEAAKMINNSYPGIFIIALSMYGDIEYFNKMIEAGADGYLLKKTEDQELEKAIQMVVEGNHYYSKEFINNTIHIEQEKPAHDLVKLSSRENEVLDLICKGMSNPEIARELNISSHTVDNHRSNLISKTGVKNSPSLVVYAIRNKLFEI